MFLENISVNNYKKHKHLFKLEYSQTLVLPDFVLIWNLSKEENLKRLQHSPTPSPPQKAAGHP